MLVIKKDLLNCSKYIILRVIMIKSYYCIIVYITIRNELKIDFTPTMRINLLIKKKS